MRWKLIIATIFTVGLLAGPAWAQSKPDLSGTWKLNVAKSDYRDMQGPETRTDIIGQHDSNITQTVVSEGRNRTQSYTLAFTTDGKEVVVAPGKGLRIGPGPVTLRKISSAWRSNSLIVMQGLRYEDSDIVATSTYTLSADGKVLTVDTNLEGEPLTTFVFDRLSGESTKK